MRRRTAAVLVALVGCEGDAREGASSTPAPASTRVDAGGASGAGVAKGEGSVGSGTADASAPVPAPAIAPAAAPEFHAVVTSDEWLGLHPLLDGSLMISAGPKLLRVDAAGTIHDEPALLAGIELPDPKGAKHGAEAQVEVINERSGWWALQVGGTWPNATFLTLESRGASDAPDVYRWGGDRWNEVKGSRGTYSAYPRVIRAWKDASLLAWRELHAPALNLDSQCSDCPDEVYETPQYKRAERDVAKAKQLAVLAGPAKGPSLAGKKITAFDALPGGEAFVALEGGSLLVLGTGGEATTVAPPSGSEAVALHGLVARAADDVLGFGERDGSPYLVRFDGKGLETLPVPECELGLSSLAIAGRTWWTTCASTAPRSYEELNSQERSGSLWRREGSGAWERVTLGEGIQARLVVARGGDDVWLGAYGDDGGTVLHTRDHGGVIALGGMLEIVRKGFFAEAE